MPTTMEKREQQPETDPMHHTSSLINRIKPAPKEIAEQAFGLVSSFADRVIFHRHVLTPEDTMGRIIGIGASQGQHDGFIHHDISLAEANTPKPE